MSGAWLILPTYNEAENIEPMVTAARKHLETTGREHHVLIVDDSSPDGTGEIADRLASSHDAVEVLHRPHKQGIGRAYLAGFEHALDRGAELVLEMDSDFSHDPADLPRLIAAADAADLVLGSRYMPGGGVSDWGLLRRFVSRGGSLYAQVILRMRVKDLTGGFKCFNRRVLETLPLETIAADGYGFQIEMTYLAVRSGFSVTEVPIVFRDRRVGKSKMSWQIAAEAFWKVPALAMRDLSPSTPAAGRGAERSAPVNDGGS